MSKELSPPDVTETADTRRRYYIQGTRQPLSPIVQPTWLPLSIFSWKTEKHRTFLGEKTFFAPLILHNHFVKNYISRPTNFFPTRRKKPVEHLFAHIFHPQILYQKMKQYVSANCSLTTTSFIATDVLRGNCGVSLYTPGPPLCSRHRAHPPFHHCADVFFFPTPKMPTP